jgi:hypothetical protein
MTNDETAAQYIRVLKIILTNKNRTNRDICQEYGAARRRSQQLKFS